jgi:hypothetical protein
MTTNAIYLKQGTSITFTKTGGDIAFTLDAVASANGQSSAQWDRGAGAARPCLYKWEMFWKWVDSAALSDVCRLYMFDGTTTAADLAADADVAVETTLSSNFKLLGQVVANLASVTVPFYAAGHCLITGRYVSLGVWNASATKASNATANACYVVLTPFYDDVQAAA